MAPRARGACVNRAADGGNRAGCGRGSSPCAEVCYAPPPGVVCVGMGCREGCGIREGDLTIILTIKSLTQMSDAGGAPEQAGVAAPRAGVNCSFGRAIVQVALGEREHSREREREREREGHRAGGPLSF